MPEYFKAKVVKCTDYANGLHRWYKDQIDKVFLVRFTASQDHYVTKSKKLILKRDLDVICK